MNMTDRQINRKQYVMLHHETRQTSMQPVGVLQDIWGMWREQYTTVLEISSLCQWRG